MSAARGRTDERPAEERAEELFERVSDQVRRSVSRFAGRVREEAEDIVAEAQSVRRGEPQATK